VADHTQRSSFTWQEKVEKVTALRLRGMQVDQIVALTGIDDKSVRKIAANEDFKDGVKKIHNDITKEALESKVPILKEIVGISLTAIKEKLLELKDPEIRDKMIGSARDLAALGKLATDLNTLLRLELGQSTQNVESVSHSYQETRIILQELKKKDPVFDYPELPDVKE
jgi:hypothetical protein